MTKMRWICPNCGKEFMRDLQSRSECCSHKCDREYQRKKKQFKLQIAFKTGKIDGQPIIIHFFNRYRTGAEKRGIEFNLTIEEFTTYWNKPCHYCGEEIESVGIDRKDNDIGYLLDNCVPCCSQCNMMKRIIPYQDFIDICITIANRFK
jgi:hypothetical protein